jgi:hypothetical protein
MIGDTITLTHNSVSKVLSKISEANFASVYQLRSATDEFVLNVRHSTETAKAGSVPFERHNIELRHTVFATPTAFEVVNIVSTTIRCRRGSDPAATLLDAKAFNGWLSDANVGKLIAWES